MGYHSLSATYRPAYCEQCEHHGIEPAPPAIMYVRYIEFDTPRVKYVCGDCQQRYFAGCRATRLRKPASPRPTLPPLAQGAPDAD